MQMPNASNQLNVGSKARILSALNKFGILLSLGLAFANVRRLLKAFAVGEGGTAWHMIKLVTAILASSTVMALA